MAHVRYGSAADAEAIARVRHDAWRAAYAGIIAAEIIERVTGSYDIGRDRAFFASRPWRRTLVAEHAPSAPARSAAAPPAPPAVPAPSAAPVAKIIGYASFGPERGLDGEPLPDRAGPGGTPKPRRAELYALYVRPPWWSTGTGRDLMRRVLEETQAEGYPRLILWVLEENARARRFYERSGFRLDGRTYAPGWLGGVTEVCYARDLAR